MMVRRYRLVEDGLALCKLESEEDAARVKEKMESKLCKFETISLILSNRVAVLGRH